MQTQVENKLIKQWWTFIGIYNYRPLDLIFDNWNFSLFQRANLLFLQSRQRGSSAAKTRRISLNPATADKIY